MVLAMMNELRIVMFLAAVGLSFWLILELARPPIGDIADECDDTSLDEVCLERKEESERHQR
jgi:hypothetical protein